MRIAKPSCQIRMPGSKADKSQLHTRETEVEVDTALEGEIVDCCQAFL